MCCVGKFHRHSIKFVGQVSVLVVGARKKAIISAIREAEVTSKLPVTGIRKEVCVRVCVCVRVRAASAVHVNQFLCCCVYLRLTIMYIFIVANFALSAQLRNLHTLIHAQGTTWYIDSQTL